LSTIGIEFGFGYQFVLYLGRIRGSTSRFSTGTKEVDLANQTLSQRNNLDLLLLLLSLFYFLLFQIWLGGIAFRARYVRGDGFGCTRTKYRFGIKIIISTTT
jgi:hypothetical protein